MAEPIRKTPIKPRGKALAWTDDDIDKLVTEDTSDEGIEQAKESWREGAPKGYKGLLDADKV